jgi:hypothetical protein
VGAFPIHALIVCNTPAALELSMEVFEVAPKMLTRVHDPTKGPFGGESSLHILTVNCHEDLLVRMVQMAEERLSRAELSRLFKSQASGPFFTGPPMCFYGSSILSYACAFNMQKAVHAILKTDVVSLNDRHEACRISGFLPLHASVANARREMYDYLTEGLPPRWRASATQVSKVGQLTRKVGYSLSSLQLAAILGDHVTVRHILRKQCQVLWVWGPVTQFSMSLNGVDSAGAGGGDIMELIVRIVRNSRSPAGASHAPPPPVASIHVQAG